MTTNELLERISSVDFETGLVASTPRVLRQMLLRCPEVRALREAYDAGSLSDEEIRRFVDDLLRQGAACERFPYQTTLAGIAVMLEPRFTLFADEYLNDLARIRNDRFSTASRVARECIAVRQRATGTDVRQFPPQAEVRLTCNWTMPMDSGNGEYESRETNQYDCFRVA